MLFTHASVVPHVFPHAPQFALSVCVLAQYAGGPAQNVCPVMHVFVQLPPTQTSPAPQTFPQPPQFALSVCSFAQ
jgi:hypothetical protein